MRLCNSNIHLRYSAKTALMHPWITRKFDTSIPITIYEEDMKEHNKIILTNSIRALFFVSIFMVFIKDINLE